MDSPPLPNSYLQHPRPFHIARAPVHRRDLAPSVGEAALRRPAEGTRYSGNISVPGFVRSRDQIREDLHRVRARKRTWATRHEGGFSQRGRGDEDAMSGVLPHTGQSETWLEFLGAVPNHAAGGGSNSRSPSTERRKAHSTRRELAREAARRRTTAAASDADQRGLRNTEAQPLGSFPERQNMAPLPPATREASSSGGSRHEQGAGNREIVLPTWQPDNEVSRCPICHVVFSFWNRKHHCRKCGRVVCSSCSPHRITIPKQFIVHPPNQIPATMEMPQFIDLTGNSPPINQSQQTGWHSAAARRPTNEIGSNPALGGGAEVRICNPCVPDPNNEPPPQQGHHRNSGNSRHFQISASPGFNPLVDNDVFRSSCPDHPNRHAPRHSWTSSRPDRSSSRSAFHYYSPTYRTSNDSTSLPPFQNLRFDDNAAGAARDRSTTHSRNPGDSRAAANQGSSRPITRDSVNLTGNRSGASMDLGAPSRFPGFIPTDSMDREVTTNYHPSGVTYTGYGLYEQAAFDPPLAPLNVTDTYNSQASSSSAPTRGPFGPPRNHRLGPAPDSAYPQRHSRSMLDVDGKPPVPPPPQPNLREEDYCPICQAMLPPARPDGSEKAREAHIENCIQISFYGNHRSTSMTNTQPQQHTPGHAPNPQASTSMPSSAGGNGFRPRRGTVGRMVTFSATEKDCVGEDGEGVAECVICFEDIEVGVEMARLECLCKFHRACVQKWWDTKGQGACPVHQDNGF